MKALLLKITATLLIPLAITFSFCMKSGEIFLNTYWQVEEIRDSDIYYIRWEVEANADSLQFIYYCGKDTSYSEIKKSSNKKFTDSHKSQCGEKTKVVIDPFVDNKQHIEIINIPFIKSLPDSL